MQWVDRWIRYIAKERNFWEREREREVSLKSLKLQWSCPISPHISTFKAYAKHKSKSTETPYLITYIKGKAMRQQILVLKLNTAENSRNCTTRQIFRLCIPSETLDANTSWNSRHTEFHKNSKHTIPQENSCTQKIGNLFVQTDQHMTHILGETCVGALWVCNISLASGFS